MGKGENAGYQNFLLFPHCFQKASSSRSLKVRLGGYYAPFNEVGVYCFANVGRSVRPSVGRVGKPYLVRMITRHRIDLGLSIWHRYASPGVDDPS